MSNYSRVCPRCDGSGRYDRGTCFQCKGIRYVNQTTKPRGLTAFNLTVTFINGSQNRPVMWARDRQKAIEIITAYCAVKGWEVTSIE